MDRIQRGEGLYVAKLPSVTLQAGDRLLVRDTRERLKEFESLLGATLHNVTDGDASFGEVEMPPASGGQQLAEVGVYACGPHPMLEAVVELARKYDLPVKVSLEEFMACAVGGCAGCVVEVRTAAGPAMKRVCVDGPVFDGYTVF